MRSIWLFLIALSVIGISCNDHEVDSKIDTPTEPVITGVIREKNTGEPVENVNIVGFDGGVYTNNSGTQYGPEISLGISDSCGKFSIKLPNNIKGDGAHGLFDSTVVVVRFSRPDVGQTEETFNYKSSTQQNVIMEYKPPVEPFFRNLYLVRSADLQSVSISWNIYSLRYNYICSSGSCWDDSDGNVYINRSDNNGGQYTVPINLNEQQTIVDTNLPADDFSYWIYPGDNEIRDYTGKITNSTDTVFLVKPPSAPIYNHCK